MKDDARAVGGDALYVSGDSFSTLPLDERTETREERERLQREAFDRIVGGQELLRKAVRCLLEGGRVQEDEGPGRREEIEASLGERLAQLSQWLGVGLTPDDVLAVDDFLRLCADFGKENENPIVFRLQDPTPISVMEEALECATLFVSLSSICGKEDIDTTRVSGDLISHIEAEFYPTASPLSPPSPMSVPFSFLISRQELRFPPFLDSVARNELVTRILMNEKVTEDVRRAWGRMLIAWSGAILLLFPSMPQAQEDKTRVEKGLSVLHAMMVPPLLRAVTRKRNLSPDEEDERLSQELLRLASFVLMEKYLAPPFCPLYHLLTPKTMGWLLGETWGEKGPEKSEILSEYLTWSTLRYQVPLLPYLEEALGKERFRLFLMNTMREGTQERNLYYRPFDLIPQVFQSREGELMINEYDHDLVLDKWFGGDHRALRSFTAGFVAGYTSSPPILPYEWCPKDPPSYGLGELFKVVLSMLTVPASFADRPPFADPEAARKLGEKLGMKCKDEIRPTAPSGLCHSMAFPSLVAVREAFSELVPLLGPFIAVSLGSHEDKPSEEKVEGPPFSHLKNRRWQLRLYSGDTEKRGKEVTINAPAYMFMMHSPSELREWVDAMQGGGGHQDTSLLIEWLMETAADTKMKWSLFPKRGMVGTTVKPKDFLDLWRKVCASLPSRWRVEIERGETMKKALTVTRIACENTSSQEEAEMLLRFLGAIADDPKENDKKKRVRAKYLIPLLSSSVNISKGHLICYPLENGALGEKLWSHKCFEHEVFQYQGISTMEGPQFYAKPPVPFYEEGYMERIGEILSDGEWGKRIVEHPSLLRGIINSRDPLLFASLSMRRDEVGKALREGSEVISSVFTKLCFSYESITGKVLTEKQRKALYCKLAREFNKDPAAFSTTLYRNVISSVQDLYHSSLALKDWNLRRMIQAREALGVNTDPLIMAGELCELGRTLHRGKRVALDKGFVSPETLNYDVTVAFWIPLRLLRLFSLKGRGGGTEAYTSVARGAARRPDRIIKAFATWVRTKEDIFPRLEPDPTAEWEQFHKLLIASSRSPSRKKGVSFPSPKEIEKAVKVFGSLEGLL